MLNNYFSSKSYTVLVMGILEGATMEMENLVKEKHHYVMVQDTREILQGKAGYQVLSQLINDTTYSKFNNVYKMDVL